MERSLNKKQLSFLYFYRVQYANKSDIRVKKKSSSYSRVYRVTVTFTGYILLWPEPGSGRVQQLIIAPSIIAHHH